MTQTLSTLIKLHQFEVDEQRRVLAQLEEAKVATLIRRATLEGEMAQQRDAAREDETAARQLPAYIKHALTQIEALDNQLINLDKMIETGREELQRRFEGLKKFELAKEADTDRRRHEALRDENSQLDEVASQRDQRKKK